MAQRIEKEKNTTCAHAENVVVCASRYKLTMYNITKSQENESQKHPYDDDANDFQ